MAPRGGWRRDGWHRVAVAREALHFASHNLVKIHQSIRMTPAMKAGVVSAPWSVADLVSA
jgi:hypothetical protein